MIVVCLCQHGAMVYSNGFKSIVSLSSTLSYQIQITRNHIINYMRKYSYMYMILMTYFSSLNVVWIQFTLRCNLSLPYLLQAEDGTCMIHESYCHSDFVRGVCNWGSHRLWFAIKGGRSQWAKLVKVARFLTSLNVV